MTALSQEELVSQVWRPRCIRAAMYAGRQLMTLLIRGPSYPEVLVVRPCSVAERAVDRVGHSFLVGRSVWERAALALLVDVEGVPVGIEAGPAKLGVVRLGLGEIVDLTIYGDTADELLAGAVFAN